MIEQKDICVLTTLLIHTTGQKPTEEKIKEVGKYLGVEIDSYLAELFSKLTQEQIQSIIENPLGGSVQGAQQGVATQQEEEKKQEVEESEEESSGADMDLFG